MSLKDLRSYTQDEKNGLKKVLKLKNGLVLETCFLRPDLLQPAGKNPMGKLLSDSLLYVMVAISRDGHEAVSGIPPEQYGLLINNLSFNAGSYFRLVSGVDTLNMVNSAFSNTYGTSSANNLLLVFKDKKSINPKYQLQISEIGFNSGDLEFFFDKDDIVKFNKIEIKK